MNWQLPNVDSAEFRSALNRMPIVALACAVALLMGLALAWAQSPRYPAPTDIVLPSEPQQLEVALVGPQLGMAQDLSASNKSARLVDTEGYFRLNEGRVAFFSEDRAEPIISLENTALERVVRKLADTHKPLRWRITGTVTRFFDQEFLDVHRANLANQTVAN